jgi:DNA modification methylase
MINTILNTDALTGLRTMAPQSVDCCVTSPPYFGLRDYGNDQQIGLEDTPEEFVANLVEVFTEVKRVLKPEGTLWLNLGDSYWGGKGMNGNSKARNTAEERGAIQSGGTPLQSFRALDGKHPSIKPKDLVGIPWMVAFALRSSGWYLRQDIIWHKPNPMPESVTDRCTKSHEYIFMLSKSQQYYYDAAAIRTEAKDPADHLRRVNGSNIGDKSNPDESRNGLRPRADKQRGHSRRHVGFNDRWDKMTKEEQQACGANKRSVWTVTTKPFSEAHFATFPQDLIVDMIKAGCPEGGTVLDPFIGSGTTAIVARKLYRNYIGIELNPKFVEMATRRIYKEVGMFA